MSTDTCTDWAALVGTRLRVANANELREIDQLKQMIHLQEHITKQRELYGSAGSKEVILTVFPRVLHKMQPCRGMSSGTQLRET